MVRRPVYLFNPENDLALAVGTANYTPAANVVAFHRAAAMLPLWYSFGESPVVLSHDVDSTWLDRKYDDFGICATVTDHIKDVGLAVDARPWGWSANAVRQLVKAGVNRGNLPLDEQIDRLRQLSHRRVAAEVAAELSQELDYPFPVCPVEVSAVDDVKRFIDRVGGCYLKSPWSGSGRGVVDGTLIPQEQLLRIAAGVINRQGSVMLEQRLDKVMDFAMLFNVTDGGVRHLGYSMFFNETANAYGGNHVMTDERLFGMIADKVGAESLISTERALAPILERKIGDGYRGCLGVDMMVYKSRLSKRLLIYPVVEINLRMTMGVVAWKLCHDVLAPGREGVFRVYYAPSDPVADSYVARGGKLQSGTLSLIPPDSKFRITLTVK